MSVTISKIHPASYYSQQLDGNTNHWLKSNTLTITASLKQTWKFNLLSRLNFFHNYNSMRYRIIWSTCLSTQYSWLILPKQNSGEDYQSTQLFPVYQKTTVKRKYHFQMWSKPVIQPTLVQYICWNSKSHTYHPSKDYISC